VKRAWVLIATLLVFTGSTAASAQEETTTTTIAADALTIVTPYPAVAVEPGDQVTFDLTIASPDRSEVALSASGVPEGWTSAFRGGGFELDSVMTGPGVASEVEFSVTVPPEASEETVDITVTAESGSETADLGLRLRISAAAGGEVTMTPDFPGLRAPAGEAATFDVTLRNDTPADLQFELDASGPAGWQVTAQPASESQASTLAVEAGSEETINVEATSPPQAEAAQYPITVQATANETEVSTELIVEVVGSFSMDLTTADQRLNADVTVGSSTELALVVLNTGSAPLNGLTLSATPPSGWDVSFDTPTLDQVPPGESAVVNATITPAEESVAGDYVIAFSADGEDASDEIEVRTTVTPSAIWGLLGIGLIVLTLAALAWVFRRFGRR
jgi:uncharacterized membrane protein